MQTFFSVSEFYSFVYRKTVDRIYKETVEKKAQVLFAISQISETLKKSMEIEQHTRREARREIFEVINASQHNFLSVLSYK